MNAENNLRRDAKKEERVCHTGAEGIAMRSYNSTRGSVVTRDIYT